MGIIKDVILHDEETQREQKTNKYEQTLAKYNTNIDDNAVRDAVRNIIAEKVSANDTIDVKKFLFGSIELTTLKTTDSDTSVLAFTERLNDLKRRVATTRANVEVVDNRTVLIVKDTPHGSHVSLGEVNHIYIITNTCSVGRVIVVAEDGKLLADAYRGLGDVRYEVIGHAIGELSDKSRRMCAYRVEIPEDDALNRSATVDVIVNDLLVNFLCVAIRRCRLLVRCRLGDRPVLLTKS